MITDTTPERYPVLDRDASIKGSKVDSWINCGRGVNVWQNVDLSSPNVGALTFTPGDCDQAPHWSLTLKEGIIWDIRRFIPYLRIGVASRLYGNEQSSLNAAHAEAARLRAEEERPRDAPIGKVWTEYTVERILYETTERVDVGDYDRPLASIDGFQVIHWLAIDPA